MWGDASDMHASTADMQEKEPIVSYEPTPGPHLCGEEVCGHQHVQMGPDTFLPRAGLFTLGSGRNAVSLENIADGLLADGITQMIQRTLDEERQVGSKA